MTNTLHPLSHTPPSITPQPTEIYGSGSTEIAVQSNAGNNHPSPESSIRQPTIPRYTVPFHATRRLFNTLVLQEEKMPQQERPTLPSHILLEIFKHLPPDAATWKALNEVFFRDEVLHPYLKDIDWSLMAEKRAMAAVPALNIRRNAKLPPNIGHFVDAMVMQPLPMVALNALNPATNAPYQLTKIGVKSIVRQATLGSSRALPKLAGEIVKRSLPRWDQAPKNQRDENLLRIFTAVGTMIDASDSTKRRSNAVDTVVEQVAAFLQDRSADAQSQTGVLQALASLYRADLSDDTKNRLAERVVTHANAVLASVTDDSVRADLIATLAPMMAGRAVKEKISEIFDGLRESKSISKAAETIGTHMFHDDTWLDRLTLLKIKFANEFLENSDRAPSFLAMLGALRADIELDAAMSSGFFDTSNAESRATASHAVQLAADKFLAKEEAPVLQGQILQILLDIVRPMQDDCHKRDAMTALVNGIEACPVVGHVKGEYFKKVAEVIQSMDGSVADNTLRTLPKVLIQRGVVRSIIDSPASLSQVVNKACTLSRIGSNDSCLASLLARLGDVKELDLRKKIVALLHTVASAQDNQMHAGQIGETIAKLELFRSADIFQRGKTLANNLFYNN